MTAAGFAYHSQNTFLRAPTRDPSRRFAVAGLPWDGAVTNRPAYLTLDIDCLDPAFAPGTGTPEPGGLTTNQVLSLVEELHDLPWTGMDCVEVAPPYDHAQLTSSAAATFVWTYLAGRVAANRIAG